MTIRRFSSIALMLMTLAACGGGGQPPSPQAEPDLIAVLKTRPGLERFTAALEETGVAASLQSSGAYTIFAPMDKNVAAGRALDAAAIRHHILPERVTFSDMAGESTSYPTLNNDEIEVDVTERIAIGGGFMVESDIQASNGVIHVIDAVLTPDEAAAAPIASTEIPSAPAESQ